MIIGKDRTNMPVTSSKALDEELQSIKLRVDNLENQKLFKHSVEIKTSTTNYYLEFISRDDTPIIGEDYTDLVNNLDDYGETIANMINPVFVIDGGTTLYFRVLTILVDTYNVALSFIYYDEQGQLQNTNIADAYVTEVDEEVVDL